MLRSILSLAYKLEYIEKDISLSRRLEFPKAIPKSIEVFTFDEIQKILDTLKEEPLGIRALIEVALYTGCRRGEIVGLKWSDIDFETKKVTIQRSISKLKDQEAKEKCPKSISSIRSMIIPECLCQTLHEYREHQRQYKAYMGDLLKECDYYLWSCNAPSHAQ